MGLTRKQSAFVQEYLVDLNATKAAERAGYKDPNIGRQLITKNNVSAAIEKAMKNRAARTQVTQDRVVAELAKIAFADGSDFAEVVTTECPTMVETEDGGTKTVMEARQVVKLKDTAELTGEKKAAIAGIKEGKYGIEVSSYDKLRALEMLGRHLGMFQDKLELTPNTGQLASILEQLEDKKHG